LAWAPPAPNECEKIGGIRSNASARFIGGKVFPEASGYKSIVAAKYHKPSHGIIVGFVGDVTNLTLEGVVMINFFFGFSIGKDGFEVFVVFFQMVF